MTIADYQSLMLPVLEFAAAGETSVKACIAALAAKLGLTDDERGELLPSGRQTIFANRVHWAKTYLSQAGLLEITRRGHFKATPRGLEILAKHPERVDNEVLMQFPEFLAFRERSRSRSDKPERVADVYSLDELAPSATPEERIDAAHVEITNELRAALL